MPGRVIAFDAEPEERQPGAPISRTYVDRVMSRSVAVFGIVFAAQSGSWLLEQRDEANPLWIGLVVPTLFSLLPVVLVLSFMRLWVWQAHAAFASVYLAALISWPFAVVPGVQISGETHWLHYLITVATAMAAIAFNWMLGATYLVVTSVVYAVVRMSPLGGSTSWVVGVLEGFYSLILGGAIIILVTVLRHAASTVDSAQMAALGRYSGVVRQHAIDVERIQVDSIVHDSVLTTLISAARAHTAQEQALAVVMAGNAIDHLKDAATSSPTLGSRVWAATLVDRIGNVVSALSPSIEIRIERMGGRWIPAQTAEALYSATVQAMVNSLQHAGDRGVRRWVVLREFRSEGLEVIIGDNGAGFVLENVSNERIGVRVSIIERVVSAGGEAVIDSPSGRGTIVSIRWPRDSNRRDSEQLSGDGP